MRVAKTLTLTRLGPDNRTYYLWDGSNDLLFDGVTWNGRGGDIILSSISQIGYSLEATAKSVSVSIISDDVTFINSLSFGGALAEGTVRYLYYDTDW